MIRVKRPSQVPGVMVGKACKAAIELAANRLAAKSGGPMTFTVYADPSVKAALDQAFHRKCAYCESSIRGTQPGDVEHYRPKGKVAVRQSNGKVAYKGGYYWLAAEWSNLLPCCADCNRPRTQDIVDGSRRVVGKANWFPIADERRRADTPQKIAREPRLLLHPYLDDPEKHLEYTEEGDIVPRKRRGRASAMGVATIDTCGLSRVELLQERASHRRMVMMAIRHTLSALEAGKDPGLDLDDLNYLLSAESKYVAYTRFLVRLHMRRYLSLLGL